MDSTLGGPHRAGARACLERGDRAPPFALPDQAGESATPLADEVAGKPVLLIFQGVGPGAAFAARLAAFRDRQPDFAAHEATLFAITRDGVAANARLRAAEDLPFRLLSDEAGRVFEAYGLESDPARAAAGAVTLVLDPNRHVVAVLPAPAPEEQAPEAQAPEAQAPEAQAPEAQTPEAQTPETQVAAALRALAEVAGARPPGRLGAHPPVLVLPRALSAADCACLVAAWQRPVPVWDSGDGMTSAGYDVEQGEFKVRNEAYGRVDQLILRAPETLGRLDALLGRRVLPEIGKAFQTRVARREDYRVARYDAADGGVLPPHRDNPTPETRHRRFTLSVLLNAGGFEGGGLRFREYGEQTYEVETGTAIVWSCSLLHEVLPVTAGQRFILGTHLFGG